jgi:hypothetical protein
VDTDRKIQSLTKKAEQEKKRLKLEKQLEQVKKQKSKNKPGALTQGATEQNTNGTQSTQKKPHQNNQPARKKQGQGYGERHLQETQRPQWLRRLELRSRPRTSPQAAGREQQPGDGRNSRRQQNHNARPKPSLK